jgi:AraC-like DNA-binding protein
MLRYDTKVPSPYREPNEYEKCAAWILTTLEEEGEPLKPKDLAEMAEEAGFTRSTFYRAKKHLGHQLASTGGYKDPTARWGLPEQIEELEAENEL